jgi:transposase
VHPRSTVRTRSRSSWRALRGRRSLRVAPEVRGRKLLALPTRRLRRAVALHRGWNAHARHAHLASWAGLCPGNHESAGKRRSGKARKGNAALRAALCEAAWSAARTRNTYLSAQFRRFCRRFGKNGEGKAIFAVAHTMLVIIWHVLHDDVDYEDLGGDYFQRHTDTQAHTQRLVRQLEKLGHKVTLAPAA